MSRGAVLQLVFFCHDVVPPYDTSSAFPLFYTLYCYYFTLQIIHFFSHHSLTSVHPSTELDNNNNKKSFLRIMMFISKTTSKLVVLPLQCVDRVNVCVSNAKKGIYITPTHSLTHIIKTKYTFMVINYYYYDSSLILLLTLLCRRLWMFE